MENDKPIMVKDIYLNDDQVFKALQIAFSMKNVQIQKDATGYFIRTYEEIE